MIEPWGNNENFVLKDYGREPEELRLKELLLDLPSYRTGKYYVKHIVPFLIPKDLFVPYDERYFPGWITDDQVAVDAYTVNPDVKFIRVQDALIYHFMCKCTYKIGDERTRYMMGYEAQKLFNDKWGRVYPGMTTVNYRNYIYSDFDGSSKL
jgi:hypothetical protein